MMTDEDILAMNVNDPIPDVSYPDWALKVANGAPIPWTVKLISNRPMTGGEAEHGRQLARERGWYVF